MTSSPTPHSLTDAEIDEIASSPSSWDELTVEGLLAALRAERTENEQRRGAVDAITEQWRVEAATSQQLRTALQNLVVADTKFFGAEPEGQYDALTDAYELLAAAESPQAKDTPDART